MRFVCSEPYVQFWGYMFAFGKPVDVTDRGTIERCLHDPRFRSLEDEKAQEGRQEAPADALRVLDPNACPKCGKVFTRGRHVHIKYCKGPK